MDWTKLAVRRALGRVARAAALGGLLALGACAPASQPAAPQPAPPAAPSAPAAAAPATAPTSGPSASAGAAPVTVQVALQGAASDAGVFVGMEAGYYREVGIEVEPVIVRQLPDMLPMLFSGQVQAAGVGINGGTLNAAGRQAGFKLVADKGSTTPGHGFLAWVVRKDLVDSGRFRTDADLRGLTFAMTPPLEATQSMVAFQRLLASQNLRLEDVELKPLPFGDMPAAYAGGAIDSSFLLEPLVSAGERNGVLVRWRGVDEIYPNLPLGLIAYGTRFAESQPDIARAFMVAYVRSVRLYLDAMDHGRNRDTVIAALTRNTDVKDPAVYDRMVPAGLDPDGRIAADALAASIEYYRNAGALTEPVDVATAVDNRWVDYAREQLGPYQP
ncbi:MAG TPA: ABC transporter substrate-binding protein [Chloroflexota bacterium]|nr:ABC transporter substrate-binding protein [Chloroflexota bacterium]